MRRITVPRAIYGLVNGLMIPSGEVLDIGTLPEGREVQRVVMIGQSK